MKKTILILGLIFALTLTLTGCFKEKEEKSEAKPTPTSEEGEESFFGSLKDLMGLGKAMKCTYSSENEMGKTSGVTYISGQKARSDSKFTDSAGQTTGSYMINDGEWVYIWTSDQKEGMKMKVQEMEREQKPTELPEQEGEQAQISYQDAQKEMQQEVDYKCTSWQADNSVFTPPTNVAFKNWGEEMKKMEEEIEKMKEEMQGFDLGDAPQTQDMCASCEALPDEEAKLDCKINFGCE